MLSSNKRMIINGTRHKLMKQCIICSTVVSNNEDTYCSTHKIALANLREAFEIWQHGYGTISLNDFLSKVTKLRETGESVKQVAEFIVSNPSRWY